MSAKFALVIANTEYQDASFAKLTAPGKDAEEFASVLQDKEFAAFDDVRVLLNEGESNIRRAIARFFVNRKRDDLLLLYFSGHGVRNDQGQLFLAANDTEISILEATGIPADFVTQAMNNSRSQRQLLILDCCNSGAFAHGTKSAATIGKSMGIANAFEGSGFGRVVLTATDATQFAWEGDKVIGNTQKSVFTHFLVEGLKGEADRDGNGRIHVDELYDYVYEQVVRRTPKQTPGKWSYKQQGDLILRENLRPRDVRPAPLPTDLLELLSHPNPSVRKLGIQEMIGFLDGKHLGLARAAEEKLRELVENDDSSNLRKTASEALSAHGLASEKFLSAKIPKEEPIEKTPELSSKLPSSRQSLPLSQKKIWEKILPHKITEQKIIPPKLGQRSLRRVFAFSVVIALVVWAGQALFNNWSSFNSAPPILTDTPDPIATTTIGQNATRTSQPPQTKTPTLTNTSVPSVATLGIGSIKTGKDGMVLLYVPAGRFVMGTDWGWSNAMPSHSVNLDPFWIDKTEVTNKMYSLCVEAGVCEEPKHNSSYARTSYFGNSEFDDYPVINVSWDDAKAYCSWVDRRLPSEAEWEKAARGTDSRDYPWGSDSPSESLLNYGGLVGDTTKVGNYSSGASPYGALDMVGNVSEWVEDWYRETYYASSPNSNPSGPTSGSARVLRGGSFQATGWCYFNLTRCFSEADPESVYAFVRYFDTPNTRKDSYGFRCVVSDNS